ncbi:MAG: xanthomonadin biosynthesis protein, partial [Lysobacterales bacterium]
VRGNGRIALDALPVLVNAMLCGLFARTLRRGHRPLIARVIGVLEDPTRLALPRVAGYARALTLAWALLLGTQALVLAVLVACALPNGALATFGVAPPVALSGAGWRWYLHAGSYALVPAFLVVEYVFRRGYLRNIPHAPLPQFLARLARRWPSLLRSVADDARAA